MYEFTGKKSHFSIPSWVLLDMSIESNLGFSSNSNSRRYSGLLEYITSHGLSQSDCNILIKAVKEISSISYYSASQFTNPANCPISFEVEGDISRRTGISITGHKKFLYDLY